MTVTEPRPTTLSRRRRVVRIALVAVPLAAVLVTGLVAWATREPLPVLPQAGLCPGRPGCTQDSGGPAPPARAGAAIGYDEGRNEVVMFGGQGAGGLLDDTWVWNGATWSQEHPASSPQVSNAVLPDLVYDAAHKELLLFLPSAGPVTGGPRVWAWDGSTWSSRAGPDFHGGHGWSSGYDPVSRRVVLLEHYQNVDTPSPSDTTWVWDGGAWSVPHLSGGGPQLGTLFYDWRTGRLGCWESVKGVFGTQMRVWDWDGSGWVDTGSHRMDGQSLAAATDMLPSVDRVTGQLLWYLPRTARLALWTGSGVADLAPGGLPPGREEAAIAPEDRDGLVLLFGGREDNGQVLGDTWVWDGHAWLRWK